LITSSTNDAAVLEFDFVPTQSTISFQYVFASEEYNEYVDQYNDVFGFFVNSQNIALIPGSSDPVTINNVNNGDNPQYYRDNDYGDFSQNTPYPTQFDGFTSVLQATLTTPWVLLAPIDVMPAGKVSEIDTPVASTALLLVAEIV